MTDPVNIEFLEQVRKRIQTKKKHNAILHTIPLAMVMVFTVIQSTLLIRHELQINYMNEFWYSQAEEEIIDYEYEDEFEISDDVAIEYLINTMDIEEFIQFVELVEDIDWIQNLKMKG